MAEPEEKPDLEKLLGPPKTGGYRPTWSTAPAWDGNNWGLFSLAVVDDMRRDAVVSLGLAFKQAPLYMAEFVFLADDPAIKEFITKNTKTFWRKSLAVVLESFAFGYTGAEPLYDRQDDLIHFKGLKPFHPRDVRPWTVDGQLHHIQVKGCRDDWGSVERSPEGAVDLPAATRACPAKGVWFVHESTYNHWYGKPILSSAWEPWRAKTGPDMGNECLLKFAYKHAFSGFTIRHPDQTYDGPGGAIVSAQDLARTMAEQAKTGANFSLSNARDKDGNYLWDIVNYGGKGEGTFDGLIGYIDHLDQQILRGILIPDEILTHEGSTGGFSRSQVAASAFYIAAEQYLNKILEAWDEQILRPLVRLNFGDQAAYRIDPQPLLPPEQAQDQGQPGQPGQPPQQGQQGSAGQPYQGPRGGSGVIDPATGKVSYKSRFSLGDKPDKLHEDEVNWGDIVIHQAAHIRIVGETQSGKSLLAQAIAANLPGKLFILDPVWEPGHWGGLPAVTVDPDGSYGPVEAAINGLLDEMRRRGALLQQGHAEFERLTILFDEVPDAVAELPDTAGLLIRRLSQRGRHTNMHLIGIGQSERVGSWGIAGYGDVLENFVTILLGAKAVEALPELAGDERPGVLEWRGKRYAMDLSAVPELAEKPIPPEKLFELSGEWSGEGYEQNELARLSIGPHSYSSTQFDFPEALAQKIKAFAEEIPDGSLAEDGRENSIHATVKYGLHGQDPARLRELLTAYGPVTLTLGTTSIFPANEAQSQRGGEQYDVLKIDVHGKEIIELNRLISSALANTETFPIYKPHVTVAYLKPGEGAKYTGDSRFDGIKVTFDTLTFSPADGATVEIPLRGAIHFSLDASGHEHAGKGKGGGQFVRKGKGSAQKPSSRSKPAREKPEGKRLTSAKAKHSQASEKHRTLESAHVETADLVLKSGDKIIQARKDLTTAEELHATAEKAFQEATPGRKKAARAELTAAKKLLSSAKAHLRTVGSMHRATQTKFKAAGRRKDMAARHLEKAQGQLDRAKAGYSRKKPATETPSSPITPVGPTHPQVVGAARKLVASPGSLTAQQRAEVLTGIDHLPSHELKELAMSLTVYSPDEHELRTMVKQKMIEAAVKKLRGSRKAKAIRDAAGGLSDKAKTMVSTLKSRIVDRYHQMTERYGTRGAKAIAAGILALAPVPLPGASVVPVAIAEGYLAVRKLFKSKKLAKV